MTERFIAGWRQVAACLLLLAVVAMIASAFSVLAVPLSQEFKPTRMVLMLAMTVMSAVTGLLSPMLGGLMDRSSLRLLMGLGAGSLVTGFVALSFATSFTQVLIIYGLFMALANVLIGPMAANVLLSRWFVKRRGRALGIAISGIALGGFLFPPIIQGLLDNYHWREALRLLALIVLIIVVPAIALVINRPADKGLHPDGADSPPQFPGSVNGKAPFLSTRAILTDPAFWLLAGICAVVLSGMKGMITNLVPLAVDEGVPATDAAFLISIYSASGFVAKLGFAAVADKLSPRTLMFASLTGCAVGMACLIKADAGYWVIAGGVGLMGMFGGLMVPMEGLLVPRIFGQAVVGRVSGLVNAVMLCALLTTPPLFGLIFDLTGDYDAVFITFTALVACTLLAVPFIRLHPRIPAQAGAVPAAEPSA